MSESHLRPHLSATQLLAVALMVAVATVQIQAQPTSSGPTRITIEQVNPWSHLEFLDDPGDFQFAIVTDRTGGHRPGVFPEGLRKVNLLRPEFVMSVGDLIEGYHQDPKAIEAEWDEFDSFIATNLESPFFYLPGNHDISNEFSAQVWEARYGASYYHFLYKDVLFLCLNSEDGKRATISDTQIAYADSVLSANRDVRWTLVFVHQPLWVYTDEDGGLRDTGWSGINDLIRDRRHSVFAGHFHTYQKFDRNGQDYFILATTGGGSSLRGPLYGQFDHVVWVTMTNDGPIVANLMLEGIWDSDIRTEQTAAFTDPLLRGTAIAIPPIFVEGDDRIDRFATTLRLMNKAEVPLELNGRFTSHPALQVSPSIVDVVLPPNGAEIVELEVGVDTAAALQEHESVALEWEAEYRQDEVELPEIVGSTAVTVLQLLPESTIRYIDRPVKVDGDLDEWEDLPIVVDSAAVGIGEELWTGPEDSSFRFGVRRDDKFLYVGVEVDDDERVYHPVKKFPWEQDGVEVFIDARPDPLRSLNQTSDGFDMPRFVSVWLAPGRTPEEVFVIAPERLAELGVLATGLFTDRGHSSEVAVPLEYIIERQGEDWDKVRITVAVDDRDTEDGLCQLWWRPYWSRPGSYPGSGTFVRE